MSEPEREVREITSRGEWLAWRESDITASAIAALFDCHPFMTLEDLADSKRGGDNQPPTASMRAGIVLEPGALAAVQHDNPTWRVSKATTYHRIPEYMLGATPDAWLDDDGLIQIKTTSVEQWQKWRGHPPLAYTLQTLTEMLVCDKQRGYLAVLVRSPSFPLYTFEVKRHEAAEQRILTAARYWWDHFVRGEVPPAISSDEIAAELDDGSHIDLSANNFLCGALPEREQLKSEISAAEKRVVEIDAALKAALGPASSGWVPGYNISFKSQHRRESVIPARNIRVLRVRAAAEEEGADADN
jgi:putative phage-type endonuclease